MGDFFIIFVHMDQRIEYFHTLVDEHFKREDYIVSIMNGKYFITIKIESSGYTPLSYYAYQLYQQKMHECLRGYIPTEKYRLMVELPEKLIKLNTKKYEHSYINKK